jgi:tripeptidyl-peptidase-1
MFSCPYVTAVGATKVYPGNTVFDPESVANDPINDPYNEAFASGGGFSNLYPIPHYQTSAAAA